MAGRQSLRFRKVAGSRDIGSSLLSRLPRGDAIAEKGPGFAEAFDHFDRRGLALYADRDVAQSLRRARRPQGREDPGHDNNAQFLIRPATTRRQRTAHSFSVGPNAYAASLARGELIASAELSAMKTEIAAMTSG